MAVEGSPETRPLLGRKRGLSQSVVVSSGVDEEEESFKRLRCLMEETQVSASLVEPVIRKLVADIREAECQSIGERLAGEVFQSLLTRAQRQTEATRVLFRSLQHVSSQLSEAQQRADSAECALSELHLQLYRGHFGPGPGDVF